MHRPLVARYHGRLALFEYMFRQVVAVALERTVVEVSYPSHLARLPQDPPADSNEHTRAYLASWTRGNPTPPLHFYRNLVEVDSNPAFSTVLAQKEAADEGFIPTLVVPSILTVVAAILLFTHVTEPD